MQSPTIHKFGGASLADADAVAHAAEIASSQPHGAVIVVSALAGVTDALLDGARRAASGSEKALRETSAELRDRHTRIVSKLLRGADDRAALLAEVASAMDELDALAHGLAVLRELTPRTSDYVASRGERLSARIVAAVLSHMGRRAQFVDGPEVIRTNGVFGGASPNLEETDRAARARILPLLKRRIAPVVPGFIGATPGGEVATLGRGGSDLSATLLGRALRAESVTLWKDVPGLLTADPRIVSDARVIPQLNAREAAELAYYGAKVLHPRALTPLVNRSTPLFIRPFGDPSATGTEISSRRTLAQYPVKAISAVTAQALVTVTGNGMLGVPGIAGRTFSALHRESVSVSLISQASSEHSICFTVPAASAETARASLRAAFAEEIERHEIDDVEVESDLATLAVVGLGMHGTPGVAARVFSSLADGRINIVAIAQGSSELNISAVVPESDLPAAMRRVHGEFQLSRLGGGAAMRPEHADVVLLGFGQIGRNLAGMLARAPQGGSRARVVGIIDRSGYVFEPNGISPRRLSALSKAKAGGRKLSAADGGVAATTSDALAAIARHALSRPIFVDLTADDTSALLRSALSAGMDVVLANKRPLAGALADARALQEAARTHDRRILHETTVGAGLPIIDTYYKLVEARDRVQRIDGCTSGTLGFLLSEIGRGKKFSESLRKAMERGYTEPDPRDDLSGMDVARKALILGRLVGFEGELGDIALESLVPDAARKWPLAQFLARLETFDDAWERRAREARDEGRVLRYVASVTKRRVEVGLQAVPSTSPFAALNGTDNQVAFTTMRYRTNPLVITGPGAGPAVTAAGVLNDILALAAS
ncbi:MAG TPA: bifunctional aspartate kinase/homoserine dehydrogenase I [Gemmatimonadaceae bacterium]|nr:bifunctional aspartate kinase/homoserine dehydrogenase I [Gemmatimonadaceae bacterium]